MQSLTLMSLQHIAKSVLWCSHFIQIIVNMTFFFAVPLCLSGQGCALFMCSCMCVFAIFKAVSGIVDWEHKHKM